jgi:hypothetical protein
MTILFGTIVIAAAVAVIVAGFLQDTWPNRIAMVVGGISILPVAGAALNRAAGSGWFADLTGIIAGPVARRPRLFKGVATVILALLCTSSLPAYGEPISAGEVAVVRVQGAITLVFTPSGGGMSACSHKYENWRKQWFGIVHNASWKKIDSYAAMSSSYDGIEVLARQGQHLVFGWRDNHQRWHPLRKIANLTKRSGRPSIVEWGRQEDGPRAFLGFVPDGTGIRVFAREDYRTPFPFKWFTLSPLVLPGSGVVGSVSATVLDDERLLLVARRGTALVEVIGRPKAEPGMMTIAWSEPKAIRVVGDPIKSSGDPTVILTNSISQGDVIMAVPDSGGVRLLTMTADGRWKNEKVSVAGPVDSLSIIDAFDADGSNLVLIYRKKYNLQVMYRSDGGNWTGPLELKCHHAADKAPTAN